MICGVPPGSILGPPLFLIDYLLVFLLISVLYINLYPLIISSKISIIQKSYKKNWQNPLNKGSFNDPKYVSVLLDVTAPRILYLPSILALHMHWVSSRVSRKCFLSHWTHQPRATAHHYVAPIQKQHGLYHKEILDKKFLSLLWLYPNAQCTVQTFGAWKRS